MNLNNYGQTVHLLSYAELQGLANAGTLVRGHFYQTTDGATARWFMARTTSTFEEIKQSAAYVASVDGTGAIPLTVDTNGLLAATFAPSTDAGNAITVGSDGKPLVIVPAAYVVSVGATNAVSTAVDSNGKLTSSLIVDGVRADQALEVSADGAYVAKLKVAAGSATRASITGNELTVEAQRITEIHQDVAASSLANFVTRYNTGVWTPSTPLKKGDVVMVGTAGTENYFYAGADGATSILEQELLVVEGIDYTADQIRNLVSAGNSLTYNVNTGKFDVVISGLATNDLTLDFESKLFINVNTTGVSAIDETGTNYQDTLTNILSDLYSHVGDLETNTATQATNGLSKNGNTVKLGGALTENTTVAMGANTLALTGNVVAIEQLSIGAYETDATGAVTTYAGQKRIFVDVTNGMLCYIPN